MSLGLPEFGAPAPSPGGGPVWRILRAVGLVALVYAFSVCAFSWNAGRVAGQALDRARVEAGLARSSVDEARKRLAKNPDALVALASMESSPARIQEDLVHLVPAGVSIASLHVEYTTDGLARVGLGIVAGSPEAYDRFLRALSKSQTFSEIKPGSENRPGPLRATVSALHRPRREAS